MCCKSNEVLSDKIVEIDSFFKKIQSGLGMNDVWINKTLKSSFSNWISHVVVNKSIEKEKKHVFFD